MSSIDFTINFAMRMFQKQFADAMKIIIMSAMVFLIFFAGITAYFFINKEYHRLAEKAELIITFKESQDYSDIQGIIKRLKNEPELFKFKFISSDNAIRQFSEKYGYKAEDIIIGSEFPNLLKCRIRYDFLSLHSFHFLISKIKTKYEYDEINYREDFIHSFFDLKSRIINITLILCLIIGSMLLFTILTIFINSFNSYKEDSHLLHILGSTRLMSLGGKVIYMFIACLFGCVFGLGSSVLLWYLTKEQLIWLIVDFTNIFVYTFTATLALDILMLFLFYFFIRINPR